ncbi:hypothetical protein HYZ97_00160, partial [Candidatus Pacearchaeota archaeon]|nr:hypothetical protein [Candidatus Pacearchaeota archaeon]
MAQIKPGTFRPGRLTSIQLRDNLQIDIPPGAHLETSPILTDKVFPLAARRLSRVRTIWYPCCGYDISPSEYFQDARIIYVDQQETPIKLMQLKGLEAYTADAEHFQFSADISQIDILLLFSPQLPVAKLTGRIHKPFHVLANNWHQTTDQLR